MRTSRLAVAVISACAAGCNNGDFAGDDNELFFRSSLSRDFLPWTPTRPVAVGAQFSFGAVDFAGNDAGRPAPPFSTPRVDDGGMLQVDDAGTDAIWLTARFPGATRIDWDGPRSDHFTVTTQQPVTASVQDPLLALLTEPSSLDLPHDAGWADLGDEFFLTAGSALYVEAVLHGADGGHLAHSQGQVGARTSGPLHADPLKFGLVLASDGGVGETTDVSLVVRGAELGSVRVHTSSSAAVTALSVVHVEIQPGLAIFHATARLDGGQTLWQPFVRWAFDPHFTELTTGSGGETPDRTDLLILSWNLGGDAGTIRAPIYAGVGSLEVTDEIEIPVSGTPAIDVAELPVAQRRPCHCGSGSGLSALAVLLLSGAFRRR